MLSGKKLICIIISLIILIPNLTLADWREDAKAIDISGGEDHTLVLTTNKWLWACGDNGYYQLGIGDTTTDRWSLVRVHKGDMNSSSDYLQDINDIDAGWKQADPLRMMGAGYSQSSASGFTEDIYTEAPLQQLESEPQSELEPQPQLTEQDIQELVDWLEELWLTDEQLRQQITEAEWQEFVEAVRQMPIY